MIQTKIAKVFYAPTARRRYFTFVGAVAAEARAKILQRYPPEPYEKDTGGGYDIRYEDSDRYQRMHSKLSWIIKKRFRENGK